jgi:isopropylmalate/homocitrate/citramalate synthase
MEEHTRGLLADYAKLLNRHGADSPEVAEFIDANEGDAELVIAAEIRRRLPEIEAEFRRRQPEVQEAIRRLREAEVVTRETLDLVIDI